MNTFNGNKVGYAEPMEVDTAGLKSVRYVVSKELESQVFGLQRRVVGLNDKLSSSDAAFAKSKAKGNGRKKKTKSLTKSLDQLNAEVARLFTALNQATILEAEKDEEILRLRASPLEFGELLSLAASAGFERGLGMHRTLEEFAKVLKKTSRFVPGAQDRLPEASPLVSQTDRPAPTLRGYSFLRFCQGVDCVTCFSSLELLSNTIPSSSATLLEPNEEWVNAMVDGSDHRMTGDVDNGNPGSVFVQGASHVVDGNAELTLVRSERVSSGPNDVVVALSTVEKGYGSLPSFVADEEAAATPSGV
ncbi:hypothetical protein Tco_0743731 [Tanacetum coccineum]